MTADPHRDQLVLHFGVALQDAAGAVILLHGRGGSAEDILGLAEAMYHPTLAYLAPQAAGHTWYPNSFLAPIAQNEPWLSSALGKVAATVRQAESAGVAAQRIVICGFSQGACLATEFVARHPEKYAGLIAFTGGLVGPLGAELTHEGDLQGMEAFFGSGDPDPHVPWARVEQSAGIFRGMNAAVTLRRYPGRGHTINPEELDFGRRLINDAFRDSTSD
jgi:phospholipase/carboxylesterase